MSAALTLNTLAWPFDNAAFEFIYQQYLSMVQRRALSLLKDSAMAEDVTQETFVRFIQYAQRQEVRHIAAFLYKTATRVGLERMRSQGRRGIVVQLEADSVSRGPWALEDKLALEKVLALVDLETAQIAALYYLDGMTQDEVGEMMNIPSRTISSHLQHFCERGWKLLRDREADEQSTPNATMPLRPEKVNAV